MGNKGKYKFQVKGSPVMKIQTRKIIEKIRAGSFYMNSLKVYRDMYKKYKDTVIGDPNEGKFIIHDAIAQIKKIDTNGNVEEQSVSTTIVKDQAFSTINENDFVFCMFGIDSAKYNSFKFTEEQKQKLVGFHDTALLITDSHEFCERVKKAAVARNLEIKNDFVNYYDQTINNADLFLSLAVKGTENIVFYKVKDYSYQQEYRFTTPNYTGTDHLELNIGDITDISEVFTTKELFNSYTEKVFEKK
ncbi:MAG: hypothetical protein PHV32_11575 [Eubacteriales bacterium]|nr:hypothetical protein [Eubacteriales bacterium]